MCFFISQLEKRSRRRSRERRSWGAWTQQCWVSINNRVCDGGRAAARTSRARERDKRGATRPRDAVPPVVSCGACLLAAVVTARSRFVLAPVGATFVFVPCTSDRQRVSRVQQQDCAARRPSSVRPRTLARVSRLGVTSPQVGVVAHEKWQSSSSSSTRSIACETTVRCTKSQVRYEKGRRTLNVATSWWIRVSSSDLPPTLFNFQLVALEFARWRTTEIRNGCRMRGKWKKMCCFFTRSFGNAQLPTRQPYFRDFAESDVATSGAVTGRCRWPSGRRDDPRIVFLYDLVFARPDSMRARFHVVYIFSRRSASRSASAFRSINIHLTMCG